MAISVVIPAYNAAPTLARALASVRAQTLTPHEVLVVDDGSTDDTAALARSLGAQILVHPRNRGVAAASNTGILAATGDCVAFLDADDEWLPDKLACQNTALAAMPEALLCATAFTRIDHQGAILDSYGTTPFPEPPELFWKRLLQDSAIAKPSVLARTTALHRAGLFDERLAIAEDQDMWLKLAALGPVLYLTQPLTRVHVGGGPSLTRAPALTEKQVLLPLIARHLAALAPRLSPAERRALWAARLARTGTNLCGGHLWGHGAPLLARAALAGHRPFTCLGLILRSSPLVQSLKRSPEARK